jgi:hypothetical protein
MREMFTFKSVFYVFGAALLAQTPQPDHPRSSSTGKLSRRIPFSRATWVRAQKVIGNIYYVGTRTLSSFLIVTPQGDVLINTTYERNVSVIEKSVTQLGFKFSDIKILLGNHSHVDHQESDAIVRQKTGAQMIAVAEDVPALQALKPRGKEHPIDRIIHDGAKVMVGNVVLVAHLTPGHTRDCTTWTTTAEEGGSSAGLQRPPAGRYNTRHRRGVRSNIHTRPQPSLRHAGEVRKDETYG